MNAPLTPTPAPSSGDREAHADRICRRVVDALLRENVRDLVTRATVTEAEQVPFFEHLADEFRACRWLAASHLGNGSLWIPVETSGFMQDWRLKDLPLVWQQGDDFRRLDQLSAILAVFRQDLDEASAGLFAGFDAECRTAVEHSVACEAERQRYFGELSQRPHRYSEAPDWAERSLHFDRLAAFLDHPFYPTARAKLGFSCGDLPLYAPEFQPRFQLNWLAVPKRMVHGDPCPALGLLHWPRFPDVGLPAHLDRSHALLPVHPFMWHEPLETLLREHDLDGKAVRAPKTFLEVRPTLSVRTVALCKSPYFHLKVPLSIRTLGGMNLRTIKPGTIHDGHAVQTLLNGIADREEWLRGRVLLTDESCGAHADHLPFLGYILRRYPSGLETSTLVPVAGLLAPTPGDRTVVEALAERFFDGSLEQFFDAYLELTIRLHLLLWVRYGIALESNQQNSVLVFSNEAPRLRLLLKDNDAPRIHLRHLALRWPMLAGVVAELQDRRIVVETQAPLAQMFVTITFQLNISVLVEGLSVTGRFDRRALYRRVRGRIEAVLTELEAAGEEAGLARRTLLEDERHYLKYLLRAATLETKAATGTSDVNKFYGRTAPNVLR